MRDNDRSTELVKYHLTKSLIGNDFSQIDSRKDAV